MQIHCLINVYNDYSTLPLAINSVSEIVDDVIVADGAYQLYFENFLKTNPNAKPWSTDGSLDILKSIPSIKDRLKIIEAPDGKPWLNQCVKRTALLDAVPQGDWFIILDADEMLYGDPDVGLNHIMKSGCLAGSMPLYNPGLDVGGFWPYWHPRVFCKLNGMHYSRKHWNLRDEEHRVVENSYPVKWVDSMVLVHLKTFRGKGRLNPHLGYMHMMSLEGWMEPTKIVGEVRSPQQFNLDQ
jgi:hypothetical protein